MAERPKQADPRPAPRLYLVTPPVTDADSFSGELTAAMSGADVAAVLLRLTETDERSQTNVIKSIAAVVQEHNAALLVEGHARLVPRGGADGAHLTGITQFSEALETLKPDGIAGVGGLHSRHDAMVAAESGADYVMFGEPFEGSRPGFDAILERVIWWAEVFELPCVGFAATPEEIDVLVAAGADFIALDYIWTDPRGLATALADAAARLRLPEPV